MPDAPQGPWRPKMFAKQFEVFNCSIAPPDGSEELSLPPTLLCSGGRMTGKTIAIVNRILRHLWETPSARAAVFSKTIKVAKDGGIWEDILDGMREWCAAGLKGKNGQPFEYTSVDAKKNPGPRLDSQTRTISFKIRNWHGGESELKLFSLEHDHEVEAKVKSTRFSLMWFSELSLFGDRRVFDVSTLQLRMKHLKPWQHLWIADTNPHEDGEDHWIYKIWWKDRIKSSPQIREELSKMPLERVRMLIDPTKLEQQELALGRKLNSEETFELAYHLKMAWRDSLKLIEIFLNDNTMMDPGYRVKLISQYEDDPGEYARNVEGQWVKGHGNVGKHFADVFFEKLHIIGADDPTVGDAIDLPGDTDQLITSWDTGGINHSAHLLERRIISERAFWMVHDEHVIIGEQVSTSEFALEMLRKMDGMEAFYRRMFHWTHWSDNSADVWRPSGDGTTDAMEIEAATRGRVQLQMVIKPKYSVRARVKMLRFLLKQNRIFIAKRCVRTIEMLYHCSKGKAENEFVLENQYKHPFDSLTYAIYMEAMRDPDPEFYIGGNRPVATRRDVAFLN